jgi:hypothetical protein
MYLHLHKGELLTLDNDRGGLKVRCSSGRVWVTQEGDNRDYILGPGHEVELRRFGRIAVTALEESSCLPEPLGNALSPLHILPARG